MRLWSVVVSQDQSVRSVHADNRGRWRQRQIAGEHGVGHCRAPRPLPSERI